MQDPIPVWSDPRFWVSLIAALSTFSAVMVALFLREIRGKFLPPRLQVELARDKGVVVTLRVYEPGQALPVKYQPERSRYYHLKVSNPKRKSDAVHDVSVTMLRVERKNADGQYHEVWTGDVPIVWRNESESGEKKTIGTWAEADLCSVRQSGFLELHIRVVPNDLTRAYEGPVDLVVTVQARGKEVDSEMSRWRIFWDGTWEDGDTEMTRHFHVTRWSDHA